MDVTYRIIIAPKNISLPTKSPDPVAGSSMSSIPWLLPVLVAVLMVVFLVISFSLHHKRFLQQRRRTCQYYVLSYHRVSGPMFSLAAMTDNYTTYDQEQMHTGQAVMPKAKKLVQKLRRFNTWSPQILKVKYPGRFERKNKAVALRPTKEKVQDDPPVAETGPIGHKAASMCDFANSETSIPQTPTEDSGLLSVTDLSRVGRSNSCRGRLVVVTTSTGSLAVARKKVQISVPSPESGNASEDIQQDEPKPKPSTDSEKFFEDLEERVLQGDSCTSESNGTMDSQNVSLPDIQESRSSTENRADSEQGVAKELMCPPNSNNLSEDLDLINLQDSPCKSGSMGTVNSQCASLPEELAPTSPVNTRGSTNNTETQYCSTYQPRESNGTEPVIRGRNAVLSEEALVDMDLSQVISQAITPSPPGHQNVFSSTPPTTTSLTTSTSTSHNYDNVQSSASPRNWFNDTNFETVFQFDCSNRTDCKSSRHPSIGSDPLSAPTAREEVYQEPVGEFIGSLKRMSDVVTRVKDLYRQWSRDTPQDTSQAEDSRPKFQCKQCQLVYESIDSFTVGDLKNIKELAHILCKDCQNKQQRDALQSNEAKERDLISDSSPQRVRHSNRFLRNKWLDSEDSAYLDGSLTSLHDVVSFQT